MARAATGQRNGVPTADIDVRLVGDNVAIGHPGGLGFFYERATKELECADITFGNLEWPLTAPEAYDPTRLGRPKGHMQPSDAQALVRAGFDVVSTANNHMMDHGVEAMLGTLDILDANGIAHSGAGRDLAAAHLPAIVERKNVRVAFLSYTAVFLMPSHPLDEPPDLPQMATLRATTTYAIPHKLTDQPGSPPVIHSSAHPDDLAAVERDIRDAKRNAHAVVVSWHWGVSGGYRHRTSYQEQVGRACVDAGADIVIGHHPHVLQGIERYKRGIICYSLGNFVFWRFTDPGPNHDPYTVVVDARIGEDGVRSCAFLPIVHNARWQPEAATGERAIGVLEMLRAGSRDLGSSFALRDGAIVIE